MNAKTQVSLVPSEVAQAATKENRLLARKFDEKDPFRLSTEPLLLFKLEFKSPKWVIWINSRYDPVTKWVAITELEVTTIDDEWGNKVSVPKVKMFNNQIEAYEYIASNFEQGTIIEYVPPRPNWFIRIISFWNWGQHHHV